MDFFILFALLGLVALARVAVGLTAAPYGAMDWAAVRAQILTSLGAEAVASRAQRDAATQRAVAKRQRRWVRRQAVAADRAKALAAGRLARLAARVAAKAAARAKSAEVSARYGHAAQRAAAAVKAHRRLATAGLVAPAVPLGGYGIKAAKRATRGSCTAANALKRAATLAARQEANTRKRAAADAANAAFTARLAAEKATRKAAADAANAAAAARWAALVAAEKAAARAAARAAALADLLANRDAVRLAHAVVRAGAKATAKEDFLQWLDANGHTCRGEAYVAANEAAWTTKKAEEGYQAHFGFSPEVIVAADKAAYEARAEARTARAARKGKAVAA